MAPARTSEHGALRCFGVAASARSGSLPKHGHWDDPRRKDEGLNREAKVMLVLVVDEVLHLNLGVCRHFCKYSLFIKERSPEFE